MSHARRRKPRGVRSKSFKGKLYSKALPHHVARNVERIQADPELLVMRRDIAVLTHRVEELLARVYAVTEGEEGEDAGEGPKASAERWRQVRQHWRDYKRRSCREGRGTNRTSTTTCSTS